MKVRWQWFNSLPHCSGFVITSLVMSTGDMGISQHCCAIRANPAKGTQTDKSSSSPEKTDKSNRVYEESRHFQPLVRVLVNLVTLCRGLSWVLAQLPVQYCDKPPLRLTSGSVCTTWLPKYTHTQETVNHLTLKSALNTQNIIILLWDLFSAM